MSLTEIKHNDWKITVNEHAPYRPDIASDSDVEELLELLLKPKKILKQDNRSEVGLITVDNVRYVIKKFTVQQEWIWFQMTSLLFPTVGDIAFRNGVRLSDAGILTPIPSLLLQQKRSSVVVKSWLMYPFMEGTELTAADGKCIVEFVKEMHSKVWVHRDPHPGNFLRTANGIATIDPIKARTTRSRYLRAYDVLLLSHDIPSAAEMYGREKLGLWRQLATAGHRGLKGYRAIKKGIRALLRLFHL